MTICFVFKNGYELKMRCKSFSLKKDVLGGVSGYEATGITENKLIDIDFAQVQCVYRVLSDEMDEVTE